MGPEFQMPHDSVYLSRVSSYLSVVTGITLIDVHIGRSLFKIPHSASAHLFDKSAECGILKSAVF